MIAAGHPEVSVERRCKLLSVPRASYYRGPASGLRSGDLELMHRIDELYTEEPCMGSRSLADHLTTPENPVSVIPPNVGVDVVAMSCGVDNVIVPAPLVTLT